MPLCERCMQHLGSDSGRTGVWVSNESQAAGCHWVHCFGGRREKPTQNLSCVVGNLLLTPTHQDSPEAADQLHNHRNKRDLAEITSITRGDSQTGSSSREHKQPCVVPVPWLSDTEKLRADNCCLWESQRLPQLPQPCLP